MCTQMAYPPDPPFQSLNSIHYYRVSHRHQNKRMNTIIKRAVIAQGIFFLLKTNKKLTHTILHPHISHPSLKPHLHQQQKKKKKTKKKQRQETDTQRQDRTRQDRTRQERTRQNQTPIRSTHIFSNPYKGHKNRYKREYNSV